MSGLGDLAAHMDTSVLVCLAILSVLLAYCALRVRMGKGTRLRPIAPYGDMPSLAERAAETDEPVALWLPPGGADSAGPGTVASLESFAYLSERATLSDRVTPAVVGNPVALMLALNVLQNTLDRHQQYSAYRIDAVEYTGPAPLPYALGAISAASGARRTATIVAGSGESEILLLADAVQAGGAPSLVALSDPAGSTLATAASATASPAAQSAPELGAAALPGEDMYAVGAYLKGRSAMASIFAEDRARWLIIATMLIAALLISLGYGG